MSRLIIEALVMLALPTIAFLGGGWLMSAISGRERVTQQLAQAKPEDRKPLYRRLSYDSDAVKRHWGALDKEALNAEKSFLQLDLFFPLLYGAAFAFSLLMTWAALGRPFHPALILAPVLIIMLADWTENAVQLSQLNRYLPGDATALQAEWIRVASIATLLKILSGIGASFILLGLVICMVVRGWKHS